MTLTLEDVKNVRFPIAKRQGEGYRATEVDDFVDAVDATFVRLTEENERLKAQLDSLDGARPADAPAGVTAQPVAADSALSEENERLKAELESLRSQQSQQAAPAATDGELERLRSENADLRSQLEASRAETEQARQSSPLGVVESDQNGRVEKVVVTTSAQASAAVVRMVQLHTEQAEALVAEAQAEADRTVSEAERRAQELTTDAQTRADRVTSEARVNADELTSQAQQQADQLAAQAKANSDQVNADAEARRAELLTGLERERDELLGKVDHLRSFEGNYRSQLADHFRAQIQHLEGASLEPGETPTLLGAERPGATEQSTSTSTPRLDALLAEGHN